MRFSKRSLVMAMMGVALVAAGCSAAPVADPADLEGTWSLESFGGETELEPVAAGVVTELTLREGEATGIGGVNSFGGTYEASDDGGLEFSPMTATLMAGPQEAMDQEAKFLSALEETKRFEILDGKLILSDMGNNTLVVMVPK